MFFYELWTPPEDCFWIFSFISLFFANQWTDRNQVSCIFEHVLSRLSNVMNTMNFAFGKLHFVKQTTWWLMTGTLISARHHMEYSSVFLDWLTFTYKCTYWISVLNCPAILHLKVSLIKQSQGDVLWMRCSQTLIKIHMVTPVPESLL